MNSLENSFRVPLQGSSFITIRIIHLHDVLLSKVTIPSTCPLLTLCPFTRTFMVPLLQKYLSTCFFYVHFFACTQFCMDGRIGRAEGRARRAKAMDGLSQRNGTKEMHPKNPPFGYSQSLVKIRSRINSLRSDRIRFFPDFSRTLSPASRGPRLVRCRVTPYRVLNSKRCVSTSCNVNISRLFQVYVAREFYNFMDAR